MTLSGFVAALAAVMMAVMLWYHESPPSKSFYIFGFLPNYRFDSADFPFIASRVTHLCLFGSEADSNTGVLIPRLPPANKLAMIPANVEIFLGLGGAGQTQFFTPVCASKQKLNTMLSGIRDLILTQQHNQIRGVELNWMFPTTRGDFDCLRKITRYLQREAGVLVSMSLPPDVKYALHLVDSMRGDVHFDIVHIMLYQAGVGEITVQLAQNLSAAMHDIFNNNRTKVTLGLPFYSSDGASYEQVYENNKNNNKGLESAQVLLHKIAIAREANLAGVSIWELGQDCRVNQVDAHMQTCRNGQEDSLLFQIT